MFIPTVMIPSTILAIGALHEQRITDNSPLGEKAAYFQRDLLQKHWLDGLYVSIVPSTPEEVAVEHAVNGSGNVIHAGVWTGRYLAGVGYQYAVTQDPFARQHGGHILRALRVLQEVTGKPGLLARGYVKGHGPVLGWETDGRDSVEWHQGQGNYADYRWYGDVSVDNFNAVLYGYAVYYDLAADDEQKEFIRHDVDRLMSHLLDHHCRILDVDGEVTQYGHVGFDPSPDRDAYYQQVFAGRYRRYGLTTIDKLPLRASLMLLPDLLIAHHITGKDRYRDFYDRVIGRFKDNPPSDRYSQPLTPERRATMDHSPEGQAYEAMYNLIRYEQDEELLQRYRGWVQELWERNWMEGNSLFTYMTLALLPRYAPPTTPGQPHPIPEDVPHSEEGLRLARETLRLYPADRVLRPVINSLRTDIELVPGSADSGRPLALTPLPINERPLDNEYEWKGNPYRLDGWLKPTVTAMQFACDDSRVAWAADSRGRLMSTRDGGTSWQDMSTGMMGAHVQNIVASPSRTYVLWAKTDRGTLVTRDGGESWRVADEGDVPDFPAYDFAQWRELASGDRVRIVQRSLMHSVGESDAGQPDMAGWRIGLADSFFVTPWGLAASGPGGVFFRQAGDPWTEWKIWEESETGAADYLHAYWLGRYYGFVKPDSSSP